MQSNRICGSRFVLALAFGAGINVGSVGADGAENEIEAALRKWNDVRMFWAYLKILIVIKL
jgi:hypothetical protein